TASEPTRRRFVTFVLVTIVALGAIVELAKLRKPKWTAGGNVVRLLAPRLSDDAAGRAGDLVLKAPGGESITVGAAPKIAGHSPTRGAILDGGRAPGDAADAASGR